MRIENRKFPYPVFGVNQPQVFKTKLTVEFQKKKALFQLSHKVDCQEFLSRIKKKDFCIVVHIYCSSTYFRESFVCKELIETISINSSHLNGVVDLSFFICANKNMESFTCETYTAPFNNFSYTFEKGDIVAYSGNSRIIARKSPEELKSVSSFMKIETTGKKNHGMRLDYDGEELLIRLSDEDYNNYQIISHDDLLSLCLHGSIVLPALAEAIRYIDNEETDELEDKKWFVILTKLVRENKLESPLATAQKILDLPINRTFTKQIEQWLN